tara:strand:- start:9914 stop:10411 length:498 start_codon:yes stop_codon:yes gene_type:complete
MKKALMGVQGYIHQIEDPGNDFDIYNGPDAKIQWVDAPDNVTEHWTLEWSPSKKTMVWVERDAPYIDPVMRRKAAYPDIGEQLDMIYKDQQDGGTRFKDTIANIKATIPAPTDDGMIGRDLTRDEMMAAALTEEPSVDRMPHMSDEENPCWKRYTGWAGYVAPTA